MSKHKTIREKIIIVNYWETHTAKETLEKFDIKKATLYLWITKYRDGSLNGKNNITRKKRTIKKNIDKMSYEELKIYTKFLEDINFQVASLRKKNLK